VPDEGRPDCPDEDPCSGDQAARRHCEDPCDEPGPTRSFDECDPCDEPELPRHEGGDDCGGGTDGGTDGTTDGGTDGDTTDGGTDGTTDGGTDGGTDGPGGRLPKTGVEILCLVGLGAGGVGIGAVLKRLGRRSKDQDQDQ
jgi:hypothetical protein